MSNTDLSPYAQRTVLAHAPTKAKMLEKIELDIMQLEQIRSKNYLILNEYPELNILLSELPKRIADLHQLRSTITKP